MQYKYYSYLVIVLLLISSTIAPGGDKGTQSGSGDGAGEAGGLGEGGDGDGTVPVQLTAKQKLQNAMSSGSTETIELTEETEITINGFTFTIGPGTVNVNGGLISTDAVITYGGVTYNGVTGFTINTGGSATMTGAVDVQSADGNFNSVLNISDMIELIVGQLR